MGGWMNRTGAELPVFIAQTGPLNGQRWAIERDMVVGRDETCDSVIADRQVSRFHARISPDELRARRVWLGGQEIVPPLSFPQFRLLQILYEQQGEVVDRQDLITGIWGEDESVGVSEQAFD